MAKYLALLDDLFAALSDPTRRAVVEVLSQGPASVGELARSSSMTLPSFLKHIHTLERCGLVHTAKAGRVRTCTLDRTRLQIVDGWLADQRAVWERRTDRLENFIAEEQEPS